MPSHPASSLQRATSITFWTYDSRATALDCGHVENTLIARVPIELSVVMTLTAAGLAGAYFANGPHQQPEPFWQVYTRVAQVQPVPIEKVQLAIWSPFMYSCTAQKVRSSLGSRDTLVYSPQ